MTTSQQNSQLDVNGKFPVTIHSTSLPDHSVAIEAVIDLSRSENSQFKTNIADLTTLLVGKHPFYFTQRGSDLVCKATVKEHEFAEGLDIRINDIPVNRFVHYHGGLLPVDCINNMRLTVSETRMLGFPMTEDQLKYLPYPRDYASHLHDYRLPITDLHTHLSSQISAENLVNIAIRHRLAYPIELLKEAGIDFQGLDLHPVQAFRFSPSINNGIACECEKDPSKADPSKLKGVLLQDLKYQKPKEFEKLLRNMSIPVDEIYGPDDFDRLFYRYRNPLEKNPVLAHDKIMQVAADYARQGVQYAELSTGAMLDDPNWLRDAIPAIEEAERTYGVKLRLLAGIPRTSSPAHVARLIEKFKFINQCPYIVGVDFLGYESNKTGDFGWALYNLARWARRLRNGVQESDEFSSYKDDPILRVHAGENNENMNNVNEAIEIAHKFGVSMRIGHAVYANYTPDLLKRAKQAGIVMESIIPSNIALNNLLYPHGSSIKKWVEAGVHFVEGTDGAGAYQLTIDQLVRDAVHAGLSPKDLEKRQQFEEEYIRQRQRVFDDKKAAFDQNYPSFTDFMDAYGVHCAKVNSAILPPRFNYKTPLLIAGASGTSWEDIVKQDEASGKSKNDPSRMTTQISIANRMLTEMLDSNKVYFPTGRVKNRGVEKELDKAIEKDDMAHWRKTPPFDMIATTSSGDGAVSIANGVTWVMEHKLPNVAKGVIDFMKKHAYVQHPEKGEHLHNGSTPAGSYAIFIGGKGMTSEFIRYARKAGLAHGLVKGPLGSANTETSRAAADGKETIAAQDNYLAEAIVEAVLENLGPAVFKPHYRSQMKDSTSVKKVVNGCYEEKKAEVLSELSEQRARPSTGHASRVRS